MMEIQHDCTELASIVYRESRAAMRHYQDPAVINDLRTYHVVHHPEFVKPEAKAFAKVLYGEDSLWLPVTSMAVDGHDIVPPQRVVEEDNSRPELFRQKYKQQFNGEAERLSRDWLVEFVTGKAPDEIVQVMGDTVIATTCELQDGVVLQPKITEASNQPLAFAVAKADVLHQMAREHGSRLDASLQLWMEQYPDFVAELMQNSNFVMSDEQYTFVVGELLEMAPQALQFFQSQRELFFEDGAKVFGAGQRAELNGMMTHLLMRNRPFEETYDTRQWEWLRTREGLVVRLRQAVPFIKSVSTNKK